MGSCEPSLRVKEADGRYPPQIPDKQTEATRGTLRRVYSGATIRLQRLVEKTIGGDYGEDASGTGFPPEGAI